MCLCSLRLFIALRRLYKERALKAEASQFHAEMTKVIVQPSGDPQKGRSKHQSFRCGFLGRQCHGIFTFFFLHVNVQIGSWTGIDLEKSEREQQDRPYPRLIRLPLLFDIDQVPTLIRTSFGSIFQLWDFIFSHLLFSSILTIRETLPASRCFFGDPLGGAPRRLRSFEKSFLRCPRSLDQLVGAIDRRICDRTW